MRYAPGSSVWACVGAAAHVVVVGQVRAGASTALSTSEWVLYKLVLVGLAQSSQRHRCLAMFRNVRVVIVCANVRVDGRSASEEAAGDARYRVRGTFLQQGRETMGMIHMCGCGHYA